MNRTKRVLAAVGIPAVLVLGATVPALAQDASETPSERSSEATPEQRAAERTDQLATALAEELGLEVDAVAAALQTVQSELAEQRQAEMRTALEERLAAAVTDGTLTQEQADALLAASDAGVLPGGFGRHGGRGPGGFGGPGHGFGPPPGGESGTESSSDPTAGPSAAA